MNLMIEQEKMRTRWGQRLKGERCLPNIYAGVNTYIIQGEQTRLFKVGRSKEVYQRLYDMQVGSPDKLHLLLVIEGDLEQKIHQACDPYKSHGEWFYPQALPRICRILKILKSQGTQIYRPKNQRIAQKPLVVPPS
jgi:hypothetical protein